MNPAPLLSIVSGLLCLLLSVVFYFKSSSVQSASEELQKQQTQLADEQRKFQNQQQIFQQQQQAVQQTKQLVEQIGPAVLNDLGGYARDKKNDKIKKLLEKYGVTLRAEESPKPGAGNSNPAPSSPSSPSPTPGKTEAPRLQP